MIYRVEIAPAVKKHLKRLPNSDKRKILDTIELLGQNPRPNGYKKLVGYSEFFRYRVGNYRIIYQIYDEVLLVSVIEVADRRDAY
jgi:mRNA interferase RelE/StbE